MKRSVAILAMLLGRRMFVGPGRRKTKNWAPERNIQRARRSSTARIITRRCVLRESWNRVIRTGVTRKWRSIESAYAYWKTAKLPALAACDRFIKLHPDHPNVD